MDMARREREKEGVSLFFFLFLSSDAMIGNEEKAKSLFFFLSRKRCLVLHSGLSLSLRVSLFSLDRSTEDV